MKKYSFSQVKEFYKRPLISCLTLGISTLALLCFVIYPSSKSVIEKQKNIHIENMNLSALQSIENEIIELRQKEIITPKSTKTSLLKQVEELAQTTAVFGRIKRLQPTTKNISGKKREGLTLSLEKTNLAEITPFLYALSHKSVIDIYDISLQLTEEEEEKINVNLTLLGGV